MTAPASHIEDSQTFPATSAATGRDLPLRRVAVIGLVISSFLLVINGFVCATWSYFFGIPGWLVWEAIPGSLVVAFVATSILGFRFSNPLLRIVYAVSASWLGALNFAFFAAVICWIVAGIAWLASWPLPHFQLASILFGIAFLATVYGLINAMWTRVTRITVKLPHLPEAWQGRAVALITDLHLGHISGPAFLRRIIDRLRKLQPDAVFISGDMFDGTPIGLDRLASNWRNFSTPRGIFYVTGNHDEFAERRIYTDAVKRTGIRVLNNEKVSVQGLQIVGVHDSEAGDSTELRSILRQAQLDPQQPSILLAHQPMNLAIAEEAGISLQLSGHTHGGQIWPWNLLVSRIYGRFAYGLSRLGKLLAYTSSGVGTWGPPLRVGTKPEIVLIRLEKEIIQG